MTFKLELDRAIKEIKKSKAKKVLLQLPDGIRPRAKEIIDTIGAEVDSELTVWAGSCFGACDIPNVSGFDLLIQWGHNEYGF